jgi:hypothetical protein
VGNQLEGKDNKVEIRKDEWGTTPMWKTSMNIQGLNWRTGRTKQVRFQRSRLKIWIQDSIFKVWELIVRESYAGSSIT